MQANRISVRQICFIMLCFGAASKLMLYPAGVANACGNALWLPAALNLVLQTAVVWAVSFLCSKTDKTFFELVKGTFGVWTARVVFALFALYFTLNALIPMSEQQLLVHAEFYDTVPALIVFLPFFIFSLYAGAKRFTNVGRTADICFPIFLVTAVALLGMSLSECDFGNLLPLFRQSPRVLAVGSLASVFRFNESAFLLMFMGHFKYKKGDCAKITLSYAAGGVIVIAFLVVFYAVYGELAQTQPFAIAAISLFFPAISMLGRIDLFAIYALDIVILFAIVLNIQMAVYCLTKTIGKELRPVYSAAVNAVLLVCIILFNVNSKVLQGAGAQWFWIPTLIFAYLLPLLAWTCRRNHEKI